ncbi:hypothetical protein PZ895_11685 [Mesorhizobium sp. YIM 152430]|uniref:hypothetical protein n=1 Tax=Mesorhizobium sp. YIM 152430 TaxID=3031761 RepID=UPI0023DCBEFD|nr:hypothetical protein [Mesorhizobium sp. YIM 152430]MDF1600421.1 hypothetical protein [Mesorhizobium sp. YIM 152430]
MDRTAPAGAAILLDFVLEIEVGTEGREGYNIIYGHNGSLSLRKSRVAFCV